MVFCSLKAEISKKMVAPAIYNQPSMDGKLPGVLWVNTQNYQDLGKYEMVCLMAHEGEPGHHFQASSYKDRHKLC